MRKEELSEADFQGGIHKEKIDYGNFKFLRKKSYKQY